MNVLCSNSDWFYYSFVLLMLLAILHNTISLKIGWRIKTKNKELFARVIKNGDPLLLFSMHRHPAVLPMYLRLSGVILRRIDPTVISYRSWLAFLIVTTVFFIILFVMGFVPLSCFVSEVFLDT